MDRQDELVSHLYQPLHEAVIELLARVVAIANLHHRPVAICGELAGDPAASRLLIGLGLREFSMPPLLLPNVRRCLQEVPATECERMVTAWLADERRVPVPELMAQLDQLSN